MLFWCEAVPGDSAEYKASFCGHSDRGTGFKGMLVSFLSHALGQEEDGQGQADEKKSHKRTWPQTSPTEKETAQNRKQGNRIYCVMVTRSSEGTNSPDPQERITSMFHFW